MTAGLGEARCSACGAPTTFQGPGALGETFLESCEPCGSAQEFTVERADLEWVAPGIADVRARLHEVWEWLRSESGVGVHAEGCGHWDDPEDWPCPGCVDVRLRVGETNGWDLLSGDPSYDTDHRGYWGASLLAADMVGLTGLARDLLEQVFDHYAQGEV